MARGGNRNVNLLIRAKDETSRVVDTVTRAFEGLARGSSELKDEVHGTGTALNAITKALTSLNKEFRGQTGPGKLAAEFEKAKAAVAGLETTLEKSKAEVVELGKAQREAAAETARLTAASKESTQALDQNEKTLSKLVEEERKAKAELRAASTELGKNTTALRRQDTAIQKTEDRLRAARDRTAELRKEMENATTITARHRAVLASSERNVAGITELLRVQQGVRAELNNRIAASTVAVEKERAALSTTTAALEGQTAATGKLREANKGLGLDLQNAIRSEGQLDAQARKLNSTIEAQTGALDRGQNEMRQFAAASGRAEVAIEQFAAGVRGSLETAIQQQNRALLQSKRELRENEAVLADYRRAVAATAEPSKQLVESMARSAAQSKVLRNEVTIQESTLAGMRAELARTGQSYDDVVRAQAAFVGLQSSAGTRVADVRGQGPALETLERTAQAAQRARVEFDRLDAEARQVGVTLDRIGPPTFAEASVLNNLRQARAEMDTTGAAVERMQRSLRQGESGAISFAEANRRVGASARQMEASLTAARVSGNATRNTLASIAQAATATGSGGQSGARGMRALWEQLRNINRDGRQTLSVMERIRGQVFALAAAYGGVFGAIQGIGGILTAFQTVEAAQSRLSVVFEQDADMVKREMGFLRREADRLGVQFGVLSQEYSKFAIATQGTVLAGENTRKIFTAVTEAARVNKSSTEDMRGVFVALTQIVSKGAVQMEELRQQLGDRLPGAIQFMADGMGVPVAELIKQMELGQVGAENLLGFADAMSKRFGPQLEESLKSTSAQIGFFWNNVERAAIAIGEGGFIAAFTRLLEDVNEQLSGADAAAFFQRLSTGLATATDLLGVLVRNFRLVGTLVAAFIGYKLAGVIVGIASATIAWADGSRAAAAAQRQQQAATVAANSALLATAPAANSARAAVLGLATAVRGLMSTTGIGLALVAITAGVGYLMTGSNEATEALTGHQGVVDQIKTAWDAAGGSIDTYREKLKGVTLSQAQANLETQRRMLAEARRAASGRGIDWNPLGNARTRAQTSVSRNVFNGLRGNVIGRAQMEEIDNLSDAFEAGRKPREDFIKALDDIAQNAATDAIKDYAVEIQNNARNTEELEDRTREGEQAVASFSEVAEDATAALRGLDGAAEDSAATMAIDAALATAKFEEALRSLKDMIPELKDELAFQDQIAEIEALRASLDGLNLTPEQRATFDRFLGTATDSASVSRYQAQYSSSDRATRSQMEDIVRGAIVAAEKLGTSAEDILTAIGYETGGTFNPAQPGPRTKWGQHRGLIQFGEPQAIEHNVSFTDGFDQVANSVVSYLKAAGYRPGMEFARLYGAINAGGVTDRHLGRTDEHVGGAPGSVLDKVASENMRQNRARARALLAEFEGSAQTAIERDDERSRRQEEQAQERRDRFREDQDQRNTELQAEIAGEGILSREATIQAALADREAAAKKAGTELSQTDRDTITQAAAAEWDRAQAKREQTAQTKAQEEVEKRLASLQAQKSELESQRTLALEAGDTGRVAEIDAEIVALTQKLLEAVSAAEAMHAAIGGDEADASLARLRTVRMEIGKQKEDFLSWKQVGELAATGMTNAFDSFAQAVAKGENGWDAARNAFLQFASDFLRQIAQMILKQALLNALRPFMGMGGGVGGLLGLNSPVAHAGSIVGNGNFTGRSRGVPASVFANAARFHTGGFPGLRPNEVPIIAEKGEEILSKSDARNALNGGGERGPITVKSGGTRVINAFDTVSFLSEGLASTEGEEVLMNFVRANAGAIKGALG